MVIYHPLFETFGKATNKYSKFVVNERRSETTTTTTNIYAIRDTLTDAKKSVKQLKNWV